MDDALHPAQIAAYRRMNPAEKLAQFHALYWSARALKTDWVRQQHPEWSEAQVEAQVTEIFLLATT
jgi:hypothetical protein